MIGIRIYLHLRDSFDNTGVGAIQILIESIWTTSMEDVSTRLFEKIKNI